MTSQQLPERPNLEQLKKQAKTLLHAAQNQEPAALARFQILPAFARMAPAEIASRRLGLHDAQSAIAREHGFDSWRALREAVEERNLSFAAAVEQFVRFAVGGAAARARRLQALHPGIARASLHTALVLGDAAQVEARLRADPALAKQPGGPEGWEPLQYVCQSCLFGGAPEGAVGLVATARVLLTQGANPNAEYHWKWHPELPRTVLWAAFCSAGHLPLARALLEAGANPTDGVSLQILASGENLAPLDLLLAFGANVNGIPGGVPPLRYILGYARKSTGIRWLLEHGADPNLAWGDEGETPLHVAARRWDVAMAELLVGHGANVQSRRKDGLTPHTVAEINGNHDIAAWLLAHGAVDELSDLERFVSACSRSDVAAAEAIARGHPDVPQRLRPEHHLLLNRAAERGDITGLRTMLDFGFDPRIQDADRVTPLHRAAMAGSPECVRTLLERGASPNDLDGMFSAPPLIWAVEGARHPSPTADHLAVVRLLVDAGSAEWAPPSDAPQVEGTLERLAELRQAAGRP
jgi:ankyrin repeat protein